MDRPTTTGRRLAGRYRLGAALGRGGMAEVFDGYDERLARPVAVKILRPEVAAMPLMRERFEREARAAARLSHPNVVSVFDTGDDGGSAFLVMERLPGKTLVQIPSPVDQEWAAKIGLDVLGALEAAHSIGLVHRDIKPGNILITPRGSAKVADFGIAKAMPGHAGSFDPTGPQRDLTATGIVLGTAAYLAPEQIDGQPASAQSDIYSLGVVLYEALAGKKPFPGEDPIAIAHAARHGKATDIASVRRDLDPGFADVIRRAMAVEPKDRYKSAAAMAAALRATRAAGGGGQPLHIPAPPPPEVPDATAVLPDSGADSPPPAWPPVSRPPGYFPPPDYPLAGHPWADPAPVGYRSPRTPLVRRGVVRKGPGARSIWPALLIVLLGLIVFVTVLALVLGNGSPSSTNGGGTGTTSGTTPPTSATTTPSTSTSTTPIATTPSDPVGSALNSFASTLDKEGGGGPFTLASLLTSVAQLPPGSSRASQASTALPSAESLYLNGQITNSDYQKAVNLLEQAGGTFGSGAPATGGNGHGNGNGNGNG